MMALTYGSPVPDDLRDRGWAVAVHNDYKLNGVKHTFWLFTRGNECILGEGLTDTEALDKARSCSQWLHAEKQKRDNQVSALQTQIAELRVRLGENLC